MKEDMPISRTIEQLYQSIQEVIEKSRAAAYRAANASMVRAYWNIGRLIVGAGTERRAKSRIRPAAYRKCIRATAVSIW